MGNVGHLLPDREQSLSNCPAVSIISNERRILMEAITSLTVALALLVLFAVTSIRFGVDSREGSSANDHE